MLSSPYTDKIEYLSDRSWTMLYSPKAGGLEVTSNQALVRCMQDHEPLLVFRQVTSKMDRDGSTYLIAGLGLIEGFESGSGLFRIRGMHVEEVSRYLYGSLGI